jgi:hypothetical protein
MRIGVKGVKATLQSVTRTARKTNTNSKKK